MRLSGAAALVLAAGVLACGGVESGNALVDEAAERGTPVDFRSVADGKWSSVQAFGAYTPPEEIERQIGFRWDDAADQAPQADDDQSLLVFTDGRQVVASRHLTGIDVRCLAGQIISRSEGIIVRDTPGFRALLKAGDEACLRGEQ